MRDMARQGGASGAKTGKAAAPPPVAPPRAPVVSKREGKPAATTSKVSKERAGAPVMEARKVEARAIETAAKTQASGRSAGDAKPQAEEARKVAPPSVTTDAPVGESKVEEKPA